MADSIIQILLEIAQANSPEGNIGLDSELGDDVRVITGTKFGDTLVAADVWSYVCTIRYGTRMPRPILIEAAPAQDSRARSYHGQAIAVHGSYGPWDGTFRIIATTDGHTEPCTWSVAGWPKLGQHFCLPAGGDIGPTFFGLAPAITYVQATAAAHGYWIRDVDPQGCPADDFYDLVILKTSILNSARTSALFQESDVAPEITSIPITADDGPRVALFLMPLCHDPRHLRRNEAGNVSAPQVHGITRQTGCSPADHDRAAAVALFISQDMIHTATRRDDALWWAIRGRDTTAAEDGRLTA